MLISLKMKIMRKSLKHAQITMTSVNKATKLTYCSKNFQITTKFRNKSMNSYPVNPKKLFKMSIAALIDIVI